MLDMGSQAEEWKENWKDDCLKTVCAFADTNGGNLIIGKKDNGETMGVNNPKKLLKDIPCAISNVFGFRPDVNTFTESRKTCLAIRIGPQEEPSNRLSVSKELTHSEFKSNNVIADGNAAAAKEIAESAGIAVIAVSRSIEKLIERGIGSNKKGMLVTITKK